MTFVSSVKSRRWEIFFSWKVFPYLGKTTNSLSAVDQACQTQTTSRAANAAKTDKRATKLLKKSKVGRTLQNIMIENAFIYVL